MEKVAENMEWIFIEAIFIAVFVIAIVSAALAIAYRVYIYRTTPPPITNGVVVDKQYEPPATRTTFVPFMLPFGDGTTYITHLMPINKHCDEVYYVTIRGKDASGKEVDRVVEVTKETFDKVKIGLEYEFDK